jgi:SAM-dependent methyltransferase
MDWQGWVSRWDAQQTTYVPDREERFGVIASVVASVAGERPRVLDLGCGPGSLSVRLLDRLPGATVVAVDADPVLLTLGQEASDRPGLSWVDADLRSADWVSLLPAGPYDAVVSTTALHWLPGGRLPAFYAQVAGVLRAGGVVADGDHFSFGVGEPGLRSVASSLRVVSPASGTDDWDGWWARLELEPALAGAFAERARRRHEHPPSDESSRLETHVSALRAAGFSEVGTVWQKGTDRVLVGLL